jgi:hypothetical protein
MKTLAAWSFAALAVLWAADAAAHPGYPAVVESTLSLSAIFDPSGNNGGCYLCHTSTSGGTGLRPFGNLLVQQYGLSPDPVNEDDPSLVAALQAMEAGPNAKLTTDIKDGIDPNSDPLIDSVANPTPEYGCSVAAVGASAHGLAPWAFWLVGAVGLALVRARVRRCRG